MVPTPANPVFQLTASARAGSFDGGLPTPPAPFSSAMQIGFFVMKKPLIEHRSVHSENTNWEAA
jgi:hypothetical protein